MNLGTLVYPNDPETVSNAFHPGTFSVRKSDKVKVFPLSPGVEGESVDTEQEMNTLVASRGEVLACRTCLKIRQAAASQTCPICTMENLHRIIAEADKIVTF